jgi:hypothetical protein
MGDEATNEAAPEAKAPAEKKRPLLPRIPTPLIVTLVGIVLTAWLLPAFTRQWDDRQKAHELQSALVTEMADASAPALLGGGNYWANKTGGGAEITRVADAWARASFKIESRLRVYFSPQVVVAWQLYSWFVTRWDAVHSIQSKVDMVAAGRTGFKNLDPTLVLTIRNIFLVADNLQERGLPRFVSFYTRKDSVERPPVHNLRKRVGIPASVWQEYPPYQPSADAVEAILFQLEQSVAQEVARAHVTGYSTTTHDLINDLIP